MKLWMNLLVATLVVGLAGVTQAAKQPKADKGVKGVVSSVAADGSTVIVTTGGKKNPTDVTVQVDKDTTVTIDGNSGKVADLKSGMQVSVTPSTGTAKSITATTKGGKGAKGAKKPKPTT